MISFSAPGFRSCRSRSVRRPWQGRCGRCWTGEMVHVYSCILLNRHWDNQFGQLAKGHSCPWEVQMPSGTKSHLNVESAASEIRYRRLFETAKDGILILDAGTGQITDANPFLQDLLGYSHAELLGKRLWEIGPFRDIAASHGAFRKLQRKKFIRYDNLPLETKGRQHRHVEFISNVYRENGTKVIQCNIRDITPRRHA